MNVLAVKKLSSWGDIVAAFNYLTNYAWVFRGHDRAEWPLQTTLEREFGVPPPGNVEQQLLLHFVRTAPRLLPVHLIPADDDAAAWFGLIQHYGGPTRLLDVTASPYVALFFAFEPPGDQDRAVWAIDEMWCMDETARIMAENESIAKNIALSRIAAAQSQLISSLVHGMPWGSDLFRTFKPFTGVFPIDPWKPDIRQSAQQARFLCAANTNLSFDDNLAPLRRATNAMYRLVFPASLRQETLDRLSQMNVTAATLFPDLVGLARSLRTHTVRRPRGVEPKPVCLSENSADREGA